MLTVESKRRFSLVQAFRSFIAIIPTHLSCQMYASTPGVEFIRTISKYRKRKKISLSLVYILKCGLISRFMEDTYVYVCILHET